MDARSSHKRTEPTECTPSDDAALIARVRGLANYGAENKDEHLEARINSRLDAVQASALLGDLDAQNSPRMEIADAYYAGLSDLPWLKLPRVIESAEPVWHQFVVRCAARDSLAACLTAARVGTGIHYRVANHRSGAYAGDELTLPIADDLAATSFLFRSDHTSPMRTSNVSRM